MDHIIYEEYIIDVDSGVEGFNKVSVNDKILTDNNLVAEKWKRRKEHHRKDGLWFMFLK